MVSDKPPKISTKVSTVDIKPIKHMTAQGLIEVDKSGNLLLEIHKRTKLFVVSSDGQTVTLKKKISNGCTASKS